MDRLLGNVEGADLKNNSQSTTHIDPLVGTGRSQFLLAGDKKIKDGYLPAGTKNLHNKACDHVTPMAGQVRHLDTECLTKVHRWCLCLAFVLNRTSPEQVCPFVGDRAEVPEQVREVWQCIASFYNEPQTQARPYDHLESKGYPNSPPPKNVDQILAPPPLIRRPDLNTCPP